jgi:hypothetical protein
MPRFELTGSGVGHGDADPHRLIALAKKHGALRPRVAFHHGWRNQPETIRFTAPDWESADQIAELIREEVFAEYRKLWETSLSPMLRAYPV